MGSIAQKDSIRWGAVLRRTASDEEHCSGGQHQMKNIAEAGHNRRKTLVRRTTVERTI
jgi:hypothetical protein